MTSISGLVTPLSPAFARTTDLLHTRCAERLREGHLSRLVVSGRDGVPAGPGEVLPSELMGVDLGPAQAAVAGMQAEVTGNIPAGVLRLDADGQPQVRGWYTPAFSDVVQAVDCPRN